MRSDERLSEEPRLNPDERLSEEPRLNPVEQLSGESWERFDERLSGEPQVNLDEWFSEDQLVNPHEQLLDEVSKGNGGQNKPRKRDWNYFEYLDKVDQELAAGRFASQSK